MNKVWTEAEKAYIRDNAKDLKDCELAEKLAKTTGRKVTTQAVRKQRQKMGISKIPGRGRCGVVQKEKYTTHNVARVVNSTANIKGI